MTKQKPYKATSLKSAERLVRSLRKQWHEVNEACIDAQLDCVTLARLASDTPKFSNTLHVIEAKKKRDYWLKRGGYSV